jgi:hypothetical protein
MSDERTSNVYCLFKTMVLSQGAGGYRFMAALLLEMDMEWKK